MQNTEKMESIKKKKICFSVSLLLLKRDGAAVVLDDQTEYYETLYSQRVEDAYNAVNEPATLGFSAVQTAIRMQSIEIARRIFWEGNHGSDSSEIIDSTFYELTRRLTRSVSVGDVVTIHWAFAGSFEPYAMIRVRYLPIGFALIECDPY